MDPGLPLQIEFFERYRTGATPLVLATIIATQGSTYRKAGARMLIAPDGRYAGLLSGGCLEGDLIEHAREVFAGAPPRRIDYDTRRSEDLIWGLGLGCEGAIAVFLQRLDPEAHFAPLDYVADCLREDRAGAVATITRSAEAALPAGASLCLGRDAAGCRAAEQILADLGGRLDGGSELRDFGGVEALLSPVYLPPRLLIAGGGPDAAPLVETATRLGWRVWIVDHRPAYADPAHFPRAECVLLLRPEALADALPLARCTAAVVMSHHLTSDLAYLRALAASTLPYVGLLGPAARRERLFAELGEQTRALAGRLHAPIGLDLGAQTPEAIALAIVAEIHAVLAGRSGGMLHDPLPRPAQRVVR